MRIYRVMLSVEGFELDFGQGSFRGGAVKNEYVFAGSEEIAIAKAEHRIEESLPRSKWVVFVDPTKLEFTVEEVEACWDPRRLIGQEGFAFHPINNVSDDPAVH